MPFLQALLAPLLANLAAFAAPSTDSGWRPPVEPITGLPLPLMEGEKMVVLADGCHMIVDSRPTAQSQASAAQQRWLGACGFGLIDGGGFLLSQMPGSSGKPYPWTARMGRGVRNAGDREHFPRNARRNIEWTFDIHPTPAAARAAKKGTLADLLPENLFPDDRRWRVRIGFVAWQNDREDASESYYIEFVPCPVPPDRKTVAEQLRNEGFSAESIQLLKPLCEPSYERLKQLRRATSPALLSLPTEFARVNYAYYHQLSITRATRGAAGATTSTTQHIACPNPVDPGSCELLWRPIFIRYQAALDAERKREAELERPREALIASLKAAFAEKRKLLAARATRP